MTSQIGKLDLAERLAAYGQQAALRFWDELRPEEQRHLAGQLAEIDLDQLSALFRTAEQQHDWATLARGAIPPPALRVNEHGNCDEARSRGRQALAAGNVGVLLTAGGQGSRLGFDQPKGLYPIGPVSGASLLELHFAKARASAKRSGARVPIYMMTSPATHAAQVAFLEEQNYFDMPDDDVFVFCQGTMPAVDAATGELLLADKGQLFLSPDGHGGTIAALANSGALDHMQRAGVTHLFYLQVDNPLVPICDAEFIGHHLMAESEMTSIAVAKQSPGDKVGNFVSINGRMHVIEYSDFPADVAERRDANGDLIFWAGSIAVHVFAVDFLRRAQMLADALPFHIARKSVPHLDPAGHRVDPAEPNALKFERFIFDLLPHANNAIVVEYEERDCFAPLKNAPGAQRDTAEYVQRLMLEQHRRWLRAAGVQVADDVPVEINPLWAMDADQVAERAQPGAVIDEATFLT